MPLPQIFGGTILELVDIAVLVAEKGLAELLVGSAIMKRFPRDVFEEQPQRLGVKSTQCVHLIPFLGGAEI